MSHLTAYSKVISLLAPISVVKHAPVYGFSTLSHDRFDYALLDIAILVIGDFGDNKVLLSSFRVDGCPLAIEQLFWVYCCHFWSLESRSAMMALITLAIRKENITKGAATIMISCVFIAAPHFCWNSMPTHSVSACFYSIPNHISGSCSLNTSLKVLELC